MSFVETFQLAIKNIMLNKVRSLLTMLGIIIGVCAVIVIVGMGNGMKMYMTNSFKSMGTNILTADVFGTSSSNVVMDKDMYALLDKNSHYFKNMSPIVRVSGKVKVGTKTLVKTTVTGTSEAYSNMRKIKTAEGRYIQFVDVLERKNVCVVGSYITKEFFSGNALGSTINVNGNSLTIIGTIKQIGDSTKGSADDVIYLPYTVASRIASNGNAGSAVSDEDAMESLMGTTSYAYEVVSETSIPNAKSVVENKLYDFYKSKDAYYVSSPAEMLKQMTTILNIVVIVLTAIAAISLLVGGIGIMNIMLISVSERTKEIGIRKSLGAKRRHIMRQFVIEAATTSAIGGLIGIGSGYMISSIGSRIITAALKTDLKIAPTVSSVLVAFLISVGIGILFGYLPAKKAARLNPIDALRSE